MENADEQILHALEKLLKEAVNAQRICIRELGIGVIDDVAINIAQSAISSSYNEKIIKQQLHMRCLYSIAKQLRDAGATLPAPSPAGTIESAMNHGLCIALAIVEDAMADSKT